jgi:hypothetical protein
MPHSYIQHACLTLYVDMSIRMQDAAGEHLGFDAAALQLLASHGSAVTEQQLHALQPDEIEPQAVAEYLEVLRAHKAQVRC